MIVNEGFAPKRPKSDRLPPGQYEEKDFPVLSLGPTPRVSTTEWKLEVSGLAEPQKWTWEEFNRLPMTAITKDIHCVTKWSKFDTHWKGVSFDTVLELAKTKPEATHVIAESHDGYTTNIPLADLRNGQAIIALEYEGKPIPPEHGGPVRIVLPHLYFWKSAKWLRGLKFTDHDEPGFWEVRGYHNYGDPWKEQRYHFDT